MIPSGYNRGAEGGRAMSTYVLMRILESAPSRYEFGIRLLTLGQVDRAYDRLASHVRDGQRVLDIGCGAGALTLRAARRGASVKGIDISAPMLEIAASEADRDGLSDRIVLAEMGIAELDGENTASYDVVMSGLCFSELSADELHHTLTQTRRILKPDGILLVADEITPDRMAVRWMHNLLRLPLVVITYLITQQTTHAIARLPEKLADEGFLMESSRRSMLGSFGEFVARKPSAG